MSTPLKAIPREWLREVEPYIYRIDGDPCWYWTGGTTSAGRPTRFVRAEHGKTKRINVIDKITEMFWELPPGWRGKQTCDTINCVNPEHIMPKK